MEDDNNSHRAVRRRRGRHGQNDEDEDGECGGDGRMKCSGKSCRSCSGGIIADCVAVCCCPCAVLNLLTLAFVKVPYMMGRKCLGKRKKKKKKELVEISRRNNVIEIEKGMEIGMELENEELEEGNYGARYEAEKVWLELYQVGHLGFGRVSFTDTTTTSSLDNKDS